MSKNRDGQEKPAVRGLCRLALGPVKSLRETGVKERECSDGMGMPTWQSKMLQFPTRGKRPSGGACRLSTRCGVDLTAGN